MNFARGIRPAGGCKMSLAVVERGQARSVMIREEQTVELRQLGANGPKITSLMFGAWPVGGGLGSVDESTAIATIQAISSAAPATPLNPIAPPISATIRNIMAQENMLASFTGRFCVYGYTRGRRKICPGRS